MIALRRPGRQSFEIQPLLASWFDDNTRNPVSGPRARAPAGYRGHPETSHRSTGTATRTRRMSGARPIYRSSRGHRTPDRVVAWESHRFIQWPARVNDWFCDETIQRGRRAKMKQRSASGRFSHAWEFSYLVPKNRYRNPALLVVFCQFGRGKSLL